jgi:hypothetical protein
MQTLLKLPHFALSIPLSIAKKKGDKGTNKDWKNLTMLGTYPRKDEIYST